MKNARAGCKGRASASILKMTPEVFEEAGITVRVAFVDVILRIQ